MLKSLCITIMLSFLVTSCGGKKSSSSKPDVKKPEGFTGLSELNAGDIKVYESECYVTKTEEGDIIQKMQISITLNSDNKVKFEQKNISYSSSSCDYPVSESVFSGEGTMLLENSLMDSVITSALHTSLSDYITDFLNSEKACGIDSWETYVAEEIISSNCIDSSKQFYVYINDHQNGFTTLYSCQHGQPLSDKCEKVEFKEVQ